jgi:hypothetical protein
VELNTFILDIPTIVTPNSQYVIEVTDVGLTTTLSARYSSDTSINIDPASTAAHNLMLTNNIDPAAITVAEQVEIERTLREVEEEHDLFGISDTLTEYVTNLGGAFSANYNTLNIFASAASSGSLCGQVALADGVNPPVPLDGITIVARDFTSRLRRARTTTDSGGNYCLNVPINNEANPVTGDVSDGRYILGAMNFTETSFAASEWWTNSGGANLRIEAGEVTVSDTTSQTIDFELQPGARISGIIDGAGEGVENVPGVRAIVRDKATHFSVASARVRSDSSYVMNVLPGEYILEARNTTFRSFATATYDGTAGPGSAVRNHGVTITPTAGNTEDVTFRLDIGNRLYGTVTENGTPVTGVRVAVDDDTEGGAATRFRVSNRDGSYQVWLQLAYYNVSTYGQSVFTDLLNQESLVNFASPVAKLPIVVQHNGNPVAGAKVRLYRDTGDGIVFTSSENSIGDGSVTLYSTVAGSYGVVATVEGQKPYGSVVYDGQTELNGGLDFAATLEPPGIAPEITVSLPDAGWISGQFVDSDGIPISNSRVQIYHRNAVNTLDRFVTTRTRGDGSFSLSLPENVYSAVRVFASFSDDCVDVPVVAGETTTITATTDLLEVITCTYNLPNLTLGEVIFDRTTSHFLSSHPFGFQTPNNSWPFIGYGGTTETRSYTFSKEIVNSVPATIVVESTDGIIDSVLALAVEQNLQEVPDDGAIYVLGANPDVLPQPGLFLPGDLSVAQAWSYQLPDGSTVTNTIGANDIGVTSPAFYSNTTRVRTTSTDGSNPWNTYFRPLDGIVEELEELSGGSESNYRRSDIAPDPIGVGAVSVP